MSENTMFMRFYGTSKAQIDACLKELEPLAEGLIRTDRHTLKKSMNAVLPPGENTEVVLVFKSRADVHSFQRKDEGRKIYGKYATKERNADVVLRKLTDTAYSHLKMCDKQLSCEMTLASPNKC